MKKHMILEKCFAGVIAVTMLMSLVCSFAEQTSSSSQSETSSASQSDSSSKAESTSSSASSASSSEEKTSSSTSENSASSDAKSASVAASASEENSSSTSEEKASTSGEEQASSSNETSSSSKDSSSTSESESKSDSSSASSKEAASSEPKEDKKDTDEPAAWTVLIYMSGSADESKTGAASANIDELLAKNEAENVNFILQTGGAENWTNKEISADKIQRFDVSGSALKLVDEQPLANMAEGETFGDFLKWGVENYSAKNYMTVICNYGGGPLVGAVQDEVYTNSVMSVNEIAYGLLQAGTKFEIVGFDAGLMASVEVAAAVAPYAKYMVASEEAEPSEGWDYCALANTITDRTDIKATQLGKNICDSYIADLEKSKCEEGSTLSVIELGKIGNVVDAFSKLSEEMSGVIETPEQQRDLVKEIAGAKHYNDDTLFDLVDFARSAQTLDKDARQNVINAVQDAVTYKVSANNFADSNGLTVFYALNADNSVYEQYAKVCPSDEYLAYLDAMSYAWRADATLYETTQPIDEPDIIAYRVKAELTADTKTVQGVKITEGSGTVTDVSATLFEYNEKDDRYFAVANLPNLTADTKTGSYYYDFDGYVAAVAGNPCFATVLETTEEYTLYETPISMDGEQYSLRFAIYPDDEAENTEATSSSSASSTAETDDDKKDTKASNFTVCGTFDADNNAKTLTSGDKFTLLLPEADARGNVVLYRKGADVTFSNQDDFISFKTIKDGTYTMHFSVKDALGRTMKLDVPAFNIKDGAMSVIEEEPASSEADKT